MAFYKSPITFSLNYSIKGHRSSKPIIIDSAMIFPQYDTDENLDTLCASHGSSSGEWNK